MSSKSIFMGDKRIVVNHSNFISEPIFLVGADRSGTTVTRLMLAHHPQLALCSELSYTVEKVSETGEYPPLEEYYEYLETQRIFQASGFKIDRSLNYQELVNSFLYQYQQKAGKPLIGSTVHLHFDRLVEIWPNARFIHLVRDGRDVARSWIGMGWGGTVWNGLQGWIEAETCWERLKAKIKPQQWTEIHYEDLILDPVSTLTKACNFIGISFDKAMLNYSETSPYDTPNPKLVQQWRHKLSEYEIRLLESQISDFLVERDYELSGLPPLKLNPVTEQIVRLKDWWGRSQFRLDRYGLGLLLSNHLSRYLGLKQWHKQVKIEMNNIEHSLIQMSEQRKMEQKQLQKTASTVWE